MPDQPRTGAAARPGFTRAAGVPWWGALLIAATSTLVGIGIEAGSGHQELGGIFAGCYALGCLAAVLVVRRSGIFTAVIQPPLVLFVAVPLAYYLFHESSFGGLKDALITCGYPLIERFPLMLFTSAAVLLIGLVRWYRVMGRPQPAAAGRPGLLAGVSTKLASAFAGTGSVDEDAGTRPARPRHVADRPPAGGRTRGPQERGSARGRHSRPAPGDHGDAPRRGRERRPAGEYERAPDPRRRTRDPRRESPPPRRDPRERWASHDPRERRGQSPRDGRYEPYEPARGYRPEPPYGAYPPYEPRRRPAPADREPSHHPISRVRYRDSGPQDSDADAPRRPRR